MSAFPPNLWSLPSIISITVSVILDLTTSVYYWLAPISPTGFEFEVATPKKDDGKYYPGIWWLRGYTALYSCISVAFIFVIGFRVEAAIAPLGYCVAIFHLLTEFQTITTYSRKLPPIEQKKLGIVNIAARTVSLMELLAIPLIWWIQPGGRNPIPIMLLSGSAFKYATLACTHTTMHVLHKCAEITGVNDWRAEIRLYLYNMNMTLVLLVFGICVDRLDLSICFFLLLASSRLPYTLLVSVILDMITARFKTWSPGTLFDRDLRIQTASSHEIELRFLYTCPTCNEVYLARDERDRHFLSGVCRSVFE